MAVPFPSKPVGNDVPLKSGVDEYGGVADTKGGEQTPNKTGVLPKGVNEYGATEDLAEQGDAANKYGTKRVPGMS